MYTVELSFFKNGSGYTHTSIFDNLESWMNPEDYYLNYDGDLFSGSDADMIKIEIFDECETYDCSHCLIYKDGEIKRRLDSMPFDKDGRHATGYEIYRDGIWIDEYGPKEN